MWTLPAGAQIDVERVARIAALLGVEGDVREVPADQGGGWMVGAADYSTASLTVSSDGMLLAAGGTTRRRCRASTCPACCLSMRSRSP